MISYDILTQAFSRFDQVTAREVLDSAAYCMERGIVLYPDRPLFYLIIADLEEYRKNPDKVKKIFERCLTKVTDNPTLAYIHYMLFCRRAEGIIEARKIFKRAREDPRTTQEIYVASALMEYFTTKDRGPSLRIFELALKNFSSNASASFFRTYVDFLALQNEQINAKILVEKALAADSLSVPQKLIIAGRSLEFDTLYGDFDSIQVLCNSHLFVSQNLCAVHALAVMYWYICSPGFCGFTPGWLVVVQRNKLQRRRNSV